MTINNVKSLSRLRAEQAFSDEFVEISGLRLKRGSLTEITGAASSGKTSLMMSLLGNLTRAGEVCAVVDVSDCFDPEAAVLNGVMLDNILWIKCGAELEKGLTITDYLVQAKGFGAIWLNLNFIPSNELRLIPGSFWYRFRLGVKGCPTLLIATVKESVLGPASGKAYTVERSRTVWNGAGRFKLLREFIVSLRSRKGVDTHPIFSRLQLIYKDV